MGIRELASADPGLSICGECATAEQAIEETRRCHPDIAIVDLSLKDGGGLDMIRALHEVAPDTPVLVLSMHDEALFAERVLKAGARGYIMKHEAISQLAVAIQRVLAGGIYLSETMSQRLLGRIGQPVARRAGLDLLTDRELAVYQMIGQGLLTPAIAEKLGVSVKTIETYRANIKNKLHLKDAFDLLRHATIWIEGIRS
jgi:DNA-binding NarL/FixJ family response regulator